MTTPTTPPPFDPSDPRQSPKVLADLINPANANNPAANLPGLTPKEGAPVPPGSGPATGTDKDLAKANPDKPGAEEKNPDGTPKDPKDTDKQHDPSQEPIPEDQSYTTTEPGFPIGQLISGLVSAGVGAGTAAATAITGIPTAAMGAAMPILQSMLSLLGNPNTRPNLPGALATKELPAANPPQGFTGEAADKLRQNSEEHKRDQDTFDDKDKATDQAVNESHAANAQASNVTEHAMGQIRAAAAIAPATGDQAFAATARDAIANARNALAQAAGTQQQLAGRITNL
ncbi:Uncharacterised protein [Mycobacteroides abscessus subsp. abscessus]|uniref:hypothetical protein n=1 Tax=Mycobacteroides abscessus TaxID=36809 RepID=UPI00092A0C02|nr:hypothetical protein [Mycobacteroides abscessus]SHU29754.1 Uncharacterised protein [Mycobacteroides abscessus subsp. abscessus]